MCLQCVAEAKVIAFNVILGYALMQATKDAHIWRKGEYALVYENDPSLIFPKLEEDPLVALSDEAIDALADDAPEWTSYKSYLEIVRECELRNVFSLNEAWRIVEACIIAGYDPEDDGDAMAWLVHHVAKVVGG